MRRPTRPDSQKRAAAPKAPPIATKMIEATLCTPGKLPPMERDCISLSECPLWVESGYNVAKLSWP